MIVVIDNTTGTKRFLPKLKAYLEHRGCAYMCVSGLQELLAVPKENVRGYILSGSSSDVQEMTADAYLMNSLPLIRDHAPVLGICFGAQFLCVYYGGRLIPLSRVHCKDFEVCVNGAECFAAKFCNRYVMELDERREPLKGELTYVVEGAARVCGFHHQKKEIVGVLFHPEEGEETWPILDAFVDRTRALARSS